VVVYRAGCWEVKKSITNPYPVTIQMHNLIFKYNQPTLVITMGPNLFSQHNLLTHHNLGRLLHVCSHLPKFEEYV